MWNIYHKTLDSDKKKYNRSNNIKIKILTLFLQQKRKETYVYTFLCIIVRSNIHKLGMQGKINVINRTFAEIILKDQVTTMFKFFYFLYH